MNIPVGTPTNPSNGSTVTVPCSVFNISVPTPVTDPLAAVTYTWSLPSGWTGSSTTNTITVNAQSGNTGTISVQAQRALGTLIQSYSVNIARPQIGTPTLIGVPTASICSGTYFYCNYPAATGILTIALTAWKTDCPFLTAVSIMERITANW